MEPNSNPYTKHKTQVVLRCKLVIVGEPCVGKTALTQVFVNGSGAYPKNYLMTVGADFTIKQIPIENTNVIVELYIFDSAGQSIFNQVEMNSKYWDNFSAVMVVYDITNRGSLMECSKWLTAVKTVNPSAHNVLGVLVGNKNEYRHGVVDTMTEVTFQEGQQAAGELGLAYFESSAEMPTGVDEPFKHIAQEFYQRYENFVSNAADMGKSV